MKTDEARKSRGDETEALAKVRSIANEMHIVAHSLCDPNRKAVDVWAHDLLEAITPPCGADAYLIAAAHDLLAALQFVVNRQNLMFAECSDAEEIIEVCSLAIAKATPPAATSPAEPQ